MVKLAGVDGQAGEEEVDGVGGPVALALPASIFLPVEIKPGDKTAGPPLGDRPFYHQIQGKLNLKVKMTVVFLHQLIVGLSHELGEVGKFYLSFPAEFGFGCGGVTKE